ncbi:MAG TPA: transcription antitermination factor NusB [Caproiciproducens sp.]|nr:transcription antitermination factor NusB [Caproiciproducens sp.]
MKRREAREQAFILIFERSINHDTTEQIIDTAEMSNDIRIDEFAEKLALGVEENEEILNGQIDGNIRGWKMNRLSKVSLSLLKMAIYEMMFMKDIPVSVSINEAIDLAKKYGGSDDAPFVNGVLGSVAKTLGDENA